MKCIDLLEDFSPADILRLKTNVKNMFATKGITLDFSPHFLSRIDMRSSNLTIDDIEKIFVILFLDDGITKAFAIMNNDPRITQQFRSIDFTDLKGKVGSIQLNRLGRKNFEVETFFYGEYLSQGVRGLSPQETKTALYRKNSQGSQLMPTYNIGKIPDESLASIKRKTQEPVDPTTGTNRHGYSQPIPRNTPTNVMDLVRNSVVSLLDYNNKIFKKLGKDYSYQQGYLLFSRTLSVLKELYNLKIISIRDIENTLTSLTGDYEKTINLISDFEYTTNFLKNKVSTNDNSSPSLGEIGKIKAVTANLEIAVNRAIGIKKSDISKNLEKYYKLNDEIKDRPSAEQQQQLTTVTNFLSAQISPFIDFSNKFDLLHGSLFTRSRQAKNELGAGMFYEINPITGNIGLSQHSAAVKSAKLARDRARYYQQYGTNYLTVVNNIIAKLQAVAGKLEKTSNSQDKQETDIKEALTSVLEYLRKGNVEESLELLELLAAETLEGSNTISKQIFFDNKVKEILNSAIAQLSTISKQNTNQTTQESIMLETANEQDLETYVNILLADLADPHNEDKYEWDDDDQWERMHGRLPPLRDPINEIPAEYRKEAKERAFEIILSKMKSDPNFVDMVEENARWLSKWIPDSIYRKLVNLGHEINYDDLDTKMRDSAEQEKIHGSVKHRGLPKPKDRYSESTQELSRLKLLSGLN